ncbi:hypothetical protein C2845_PM04G31400 [Panicum miliaceum]|uniref:TFIIS N-terminal domain-containing protein n=1 Tax=Panicum miliaceum TaxID=4540 RepID=A0A3L6QNG2_PANMI|nr:hypothetical protein C2845_PM04G31400 [Panicum miliaceum]
MALRRWKPFLGAFPHIDTAIEAADADGLLSRDEIRSARSRIVEMLCDAADNDDEKAEGFCVLLDEAMAASLATLRAVPSERIALASDDLVGAVGALMRDHASERVRGLARDVVRGVAVEKKMEATKRKLHERYQEEAEDAKRQRTIEVIRPPRPPTGQRQRNAHPAVRARAPAGELRVVRGSSSCM